MLDDSTGLGDLAQERQVRQQRQGSDRPQHTRQAGSQERSYAGWVELCAGGVSKLASCGGHRHRPLVAAGSGHDLEDVGNSDDAPCVRDLVAGQAAWISHAVEPFVVLGDRGAPLAQPLEQRAGQHGALVGVLADQVPLDGYERGRLVEHGRGHADLAEVMQQRRPAQPVARRLRQVQLGGQNVGEDPDPLGVSAGPPVMGAQAGQQAEDAGRGLTGSLAGTIARPLGEDPGVPGCPREPVARRGMVREEHGHPEQGGEREYPADDAFDQEARDDREHPEGNDPAQQRDAADKRRRQSRDDVRAGDRDHEHGQGERACEYGTRLPARLVHSESFE